MCPVGFFGTQKGQMSCLSCDHDNWIVTNVLQDVKPMDAFYTSGLRCNWKCNTGFHFESDFTTFKNSLYDTWRSPWGHHCNDILSPDYCDFFDWEEIYMGITSLNNPSVFDSCCQCSQMGLQKGYITQTVCNMTKIEHSICVHNTSHQCVGDTLSLFTGGVELCVSKNVYPSSEVKHCIFEHTWKDVRDDRTVFKTGGLGRRMTEEIEVWVCTVRHPCTVGGDWMCFTFSETHLVIVPWGLNSVLGVVRENF